MLESTALITQNEAMNLLTYRESGFGYIWRVFDDETLSPAYHGGFAAHGHLGQYIMVLPSVDMVVAHNTGPVD